MSTKNVFKFIQHLERQFTVTVKVNLKEGERKVWGSPNQKDLTSGPKYMEIHPTAV